VLTVASICNECSLKWDIVNTQLRNRRFQLGAELADLLGCDTEHAIGAANEAFGKAKSLTKKKHKAREMNDE
jgi:hypothetical protein